jgi:hypothetical protein
MDRTTRATQEPLKARTGTTRSAVVTLRAEGRLGEHLVLGQTGRAGPGRATPAPAVWDGACWATCCSRPSWPAPA